jgi:hypothetical protein
MTESENGIFCNEHVDKLLLGKYIRTVLETPEEEVSDSDRWFYDRIFNNDNIKDSNYYLGLSDLELAEELSSLFFNSHQDEDFPKDICPIESLQGIPDKDLIKYLSLMLGITSKKELLTTIKDHYKTYSNFKDAVKQLEENIKSNPKYMETF